MSESNLITQHVLSQKKHPTIFLYQKYAVHLPHIHSGFTSSPIRERHISHTIMKNVIVWLALFFCPLLIKAQLLEKEETRTLLCGLKISNNRFDRLLAFEHHYDYPHYKGYRYHFVRTPVMSKDCHPGTTVEHIDRWGLYYTKELTYDIDSLTQKLWKLFPAGQDSLQLVVYPRVTRDGFVQSLIMVLEQAERPEWFDAELIKKIYYLVFETKFSPIECNYDFIAPDQELTLWITP